MQKTSKFKITKILSGVHLNIINKLDTKYEINQFNCIGGVDTSAKLQSSNGHNSYKKNVQLNWSCGKVFYTLR